MKQGFPSPVKRNSCEPGDNATPGNPEDVSALPRNASPDLAMSTDVFCTSNSLPVPGKRKTSAADALQADCRLRTGRPEHPMPKTRRSSFQTTNVLPGRRVFRLASRSDAVVMVEHGDEKGNGVLCANEKALGC